jgi:hypothetical protein
MWHDITQPSSSVEAKMVLDAHQTTRLMNDAGQQTPHNDLGHDPEQREAFPHMRRRGSSPRWWPSALKYLSDSDNHGASDIAG